MDGLGALYLDSSVITESQFSGVYLYWGTARITRSNFTNNGGCGAISYMGDLTVDSSIFADNTAQEGAAIYFYQKLYPTLVQSVTSSKFERNRATSVTGVGGGAIYIYGAQVTIDQCEFLDNFASYTQYFYWYGFIEAMGGAIYTTSSTLTVSRTRFEGNWANSNEQGGSGGAILAGSSSVLTLQGGCEFVANEASLGAALAVSSAEAIVMDATFSSNVASTAGGALYMDTASSFSGSGLLIFEFNQPDDIAGTNVDDAVCVSPCAAGTYGNCSLPVGSTECYVGCECVDCPGGTYSTTTMATSISSCLECGSGQTSEVGATVCSSCPVGTFTADSPTDTGGGLSKQVLSGAKYCNHCPSGYYAAATSTLVCNGCGEGSARSSSQRHLLFTFF